jgi:hypothetical protein
VNHLVLEDVLELRVRAAERHHRAVPLEIGDAAGSFAGRLAQRVGLLEIGVGGVQNDRLPFPELVVQHLGQAGVAAFRHAGGVHGRDPLALVVVDVEVLGLDDLEIELAVLDPVAPEILGVEESRREQQEEECREGASEHNYLDLGRADQQLGCIVPETLELVKRAGLRVKQMNHEIDEVE